VGRSVVLISREPVGSPEYCICPVDGHRFPKSLNVPCRDQVCPQHRSMRLVANDVPHSDGKGWR